MKTFGSFTPKIQHVLSAPSTDKFHRCHWPGCTTKCKPAFWGCRKHWFTLPESLRRKIWQTYRPGQENDKNPSREYLAAVNEIQTWIKEKFLETTKSD